MPNLISDRFDVEFDREGKLVARQEVDGLLAGLLTSGATDLIVMSHGWNNDMVEARALYAKWLASANTLMGNDTVALPGRKLAFCGVLWPSKKFADDENKPGGAASANPADRVGGLQRRIRELASGFGPEHQAAFTKLAALVPNLDDEDKQAEFVETFRDVLGEPQDDGDGDTHDSFRDKPGEWVFEQLSLDVDEDDGAPAMPKGGAAGIGDIWDSIVNGARNVLNAGTYYEMKARAGVVGAGGLNRFLSEVKQRFPALKLHLVGHSFGGRVVAACVDGPDHKSALRVETVSLLQAAFSHYAFADKGDKHPEGFFRQVLTDQRVSGPMLITHTRNDHAVGYAYAVASRLARQTAAGLGDAHDVYGGLGSNGAQDTPKVVKARLQAVGSKYAFSAGSPNNLKADDFVSGHSDIAGREVVYAVLTAISST